MIKESLQNQNVPKSFSVASGVLSNASTFPSSCSFYVLFGVLVSIDCWISSLGEPFVSSNVVCATITSISSSKKWNIW